jgi:hypothetical protein
MLWNGYQRLCISFLHEISYLIAIVSIQSCCIIHIVLISYGKLVRNIASRLEKQSLDVLISVLLFHLSFVSLIGIHSDVLAS